MPCVLSWKGSTLSDINSEWETMLSRAVWMSCKTGKTGQPIKDSDEGGWEKINLQRSLQVGKALKFSGRWTFMEVCDNARGFIWCRCLWEYKWLGVHLQKSCIQPSPEKVTLGPKPGLSYNDDRDDDNHNWHWKGVGGSHYFWLFFGCF